MITSFKFRCDELARDANTEFTENTIEAQRG